MNQRELVQEGGKVLKAASELLMLLHCEYPGMFPDAIRISLDLDVINERLVRRLGGQVHGEKEREREREPYVRTYRR